MVTTYLREFEKDIDKEHVKEFSKEYKSAQTNVKRQRISFKLKRTKVIVLWLHL